MNIRGAHLLAGLVSAAGLVSLAAGCELIAAVDRDKIVSGESGTGGTGGTGGMGGAGGHHSGPGGMGGEGGQGGAGGGPECTTEADCPDTGSECVLRACTGGTCGTSNAAAGTPLASQTNGDCKLAVCDGMGGTTVDPLDTDIENDGKSCTTDTCDAAGMPVHTPLAAGTSCSEAGGKVCDGKGACVECAQDSDCATGVCQSGACMAVSCGDGMKNGDETDLDCGGSCGPCADGQVCLEANDCTSAVCTGGICASATCSDNVKNQGESDVDCGGVNCSKCDPGKGCTINADCLGGSCAMGTCAPTCLDLTQNNGETDVDCGGPNCADCGEGLMCAGDGDCMSAFCDPSTMLCAAPSCSDGYPNGMETDVDCGGSCPTDCADGGKCLGNGDCMSAFCNPMTSTCAAPTCMDGYQNGGEAGVDCGGPCAAACVGSPCASDGACASGMCYEGACVADVNGCKVATAQDLTAQSAVTVTFANGNLTFAPKCIKVKVGTAVTLMGNFGSHPTIGGVVVNATPTPAASGPFVPVTSSGSSKVFTMSQAGTFPYYCQPHATQGMTAAVFVVP